MSIPPLLRELLTAVGPSGREAPVAAVWREAAAGFAEVSSDTLGTSFASVPTGRAEEGAPLLALVGHIDEIGVLVTHVGDDGLLAFSVLGGYDPEQMAGQRVLIAGRDGIVTGVVGRRALSRDERRDRPALKHSDLHIDIGASSREDAARVVRPGDVAVWEGKPVELANNRIASRALDNRLGAYAALEATRRVAEAGDAQVDVVAVAAVQEELGYHGARTAVYALDPQVAIAIDVTWSTDVPGGNPKRVGKIELGAGAAVSVGPIVSPVVSDLLRETAEADGIGHSIEVYSDRTQTDADVVYISRAGVPTGLVSVPVRYMHSPVEVCSLDDLEAVIALVTAFARRLTRETSFLR
jgi:putative aminopeptidase FrvX